MPERVEELSKYQNVKDNEIPHYKFGKIIRFERKDVDTWFDTYRREGYAIERRAQEILKKVRGKKSNFPKETSISRENNIPTGKKEDNGCQKFNTCEKTHPSLNTSRGG